MKRRKMGIAVMARRIAATAVAAVVVMAPTFSWAQTPAEPERYFYGPHMMWGGGWYGMILGPLFMFLVLVAVIAGVALVTRWFGMPWYGPQPPNLAPPGPTPLGILKERFARGEIDKAEYEERRRVLGE